MKRMWFAALENPGALPDVVSDVREEIARPWQVILYNDDIHTFEEVIHQLIKATGCTAEHAESVAWTVHTKGKALAFEGEFTDCFRVNLILREIQLITEIVG